MAEQKTVTEISLIGAETLMGRELNEVLDQRRPDLSIKTFAASGEGNFGEKDGEAVYLDPLTVGAIQSDFALLFAGTPAGAEKTYELVKQAGRKPAIIDCTGLLESKPEARITAPFLQELAKPDTWLFVIAHPAATAVAMVLGRLSRYRKVRSAIINILEPASERGKGGISELHNQTTNLLAFKTLPKEVFDAQLSFNLLPQYGGDAPVQLSDAEQRIERDLATVLSRHPNRATIPMPSIRLVQAPVFHGYSMSVWVEFETDVNAEELSEALATAQIEVRSADQDPPTNVGAAAQSGLAAGDIRVDRNNSRAAWIWIAMDNLRITAESAAELLPPLENKR
ncbi:MAG: Asd/ArgC dimerization domain-containing protein [Bryobacteraceae bacterium]